MTARSEQLAQNLAQVRAQVQAACDVAQRENDVTIVVVTKTHPVEDIRILYDLGVQVMGENKDQEAKRKTQECADLAIEWHFIGQLQRNKAKSVAAYADVIESVDRQELVQALAKCDAACDVLIQVALDPPGTEHRGGVLLGEFDALVDEIRATPNLTLRGVMGVAPLGQDPAEAFTRLAGARARLMRQLPQASWMSAGMSHDLSEAIAAGATHVRIGSAILGERHYGR